MPVALIDELTQLYEVQKIDAQIYQREQTLKALPDGEAEKKAAIELLKRHDAAVAQLQKDEAAQRNRELELKSIEQKRAAVHEKLYSGRITNPKELGDLQKDEEMLDAQIGKLEESVLELMEQAEASRTHEATIGRELARAKRAWQDTVARTKAETARLQQELAALRPQRTEAATPVDKTLLRRYDDIRQRREGVGMALTHGESCSACHIKINNEEILRLREGIELTNCGNCGRILLWQQE
jgi:predicted  nucleic acid-binding Zn-ribbon protein